MKLNKEQRKAIECVSGPMLIVAGAGTGKTTVITEKIKRLIESGNDPQEILALTFSDKSAEEMVERLDKVMPYGYEEPWVCTFHKFGDRVLRHEGLEIGINPGFTIMNQAQQYLLIKEHLFEFELGFYRPLGNPSKFIGALLQVFSRMGDELIMAKDLKTFANSKFKAASSKEDEEEGEKMLEVARAMEKYKKLKYQEKLMDFGDLLTETYRLFSTRKSLAKKYRNKFKHVLVDEFQDTNLVQYELVKLLCPPSKKVGLTVVGDDSQSIYRFRGAAISNILQFMDDYDSAEQVVLTENYRSMQAILDGAYRLIKHNDPETLEAKLGISKDLVSRVEWRGSRVERKKTNEIQGDVRIVECETGEDEVEMVVGKIVELLADKQLSYQDVAIVARSNSQLEPYVTALKQAGLPYRRVGNRGLFDQEEVRLLMSFVQVMVKPEDDMALFDLMYWEKFAIPSEKILMWINRARKETRSMWEIIKDKPECGELVEIVSEARKKIAKDKPSKILFDLVERIEYVKELIEKESVENTLKLRNLNMFFRYLRQLESGGVSNLMELFGELEKLAEAGENPRQAEVEDIDAITVTTAHSSKGLEFEVVFVVSMVAGRFPSYTRRDPIELPDEVLKEELPDWDHTREERRLFYVAVTRAKTWLYLSWSKDYGGAKKWKPSGFLEETGFEQIKFLPETQLSLLGGKNSNKAVKQQSLMTTTREFVLKTTSYSELDTYKACPLKYKYRYILRIPAEPHHSLAFGRTIHETLQQFHMVEIAGEKVSKKKLLDLYEDNFVDEGYESKEHRQERFESGRESLKKYFEHYRQVLGKPWRLEQPFSLQISGVRFKGKIDRIDKTEEGFEIIDYKTGSADKKDKVDKDEQLTIYGLAAREALKIQASKMALYFLDSNEKAETQRSEKQLDAKKKDLKKRIDKLKNSNFEATPNPFICKFCEFKKICPVAAV